MSLDKSLYQLIVRQLETDGLGALASQLAQETNALVPDAKTDVNEIPNGDQLRRLVEAGSTALKRRRPDNPDGALVEFPITEDQAGTLDSEDFFPSLSKPFPNYGKGTIVSSHKMTCTVVKFSPDGKSCVSGSADCCIKLMEVPKMHYYSHVKSGSGDDYTQNRPVMRTFYDHASAVTDLDFHPIEQILASGSKDCTIKLFDYNKQGRKQASYSHKDTHSVRTLHFHPSGDFLVAGTEHSMVRLYDVNTWQAYVCPDPRHHHLAPITSVRYANQGNIYASGSKDGCIKIWDGVNNTCINTIDRAHSGEIVSSVQFSPSGKYLLSGGKDSVHRLWEISTGKEIVSYGGGVNETTRTRTIFSYTGDFVLSSSEDDHSILAWDTRTGEMVRKMPGHTACVKWLDASPSEEGFVSCGEDTKVRFWTTNGDVK